MQNSDTSRRRWSTTTVLSWWLRTVLCLHSALCILHSAASAQTPQLIDRILARVSGDSITLTDLQAAQGLGLVAPALSVEQGTQAMVDRYLMLSDVQRFPPPEPAASAVEAQVARLRAAAGARLPALMQSTGLDEARLRELATDSLRIEAYVAQRFGATIQVTDEEAEAYFLLHRPEFVRNGAPMTFEEAAPLARERAGAERRQAAVDRWIQDLRARADVTIPRTSAH